MKVYFTKKDLVNFGKYLLSDRRNESIKGNKKVVQDSDVANFLETNKKVD